LLPKLSHHWTVKLDIKRKENEGIILPVACQVNQACLECLVNLDFQVNRQQDNSINLLSLHSLISLLGQALALLSPDSLDNRNPDSLDNRNPDSLDTRNPDSLDRNPDNSDSLNLDNSDSLNLDNSDSLNPVSSNQLVNQVNFNQLALLLLDNLLVLLNPIHNQYSNSRNPWASWA